MPPATSTSSPATSPTTTALSFKSTTSSKTPNAKAGGHRRRPQTGRPRLRRLRTRDPQRGTRGWDGEMRPTHLMEVSRYVELTPGATGNRSKRSSAARAAYLRQAIRTLITEGYLTAEAGTRGAQLHRSLVPFRETQMTHADLVPNPAEPATQKGHPDDHHPPPHQRLDGPQPRQPHPPLQHPHRPLRPRSRHHQEDAMSAATSGTAVVLRNPSSPTCAGTGT